jgi:hypothetical protein
MTARQPFIYGPNGPPHFGTLDSGDYLQTPAAAAGNASLNMPHGSAPTSPSDGDMWTTSAGLFVRINGVTIGPLAASAGAPAVTIAQKQSTSAIANNTFVMNSWGSSDVIRDDVGAWSSGSPTRLTVPSGYGHIRITGRYAWAANATGGRWLNTYKNGSFLHGIMGPATASDTNRATYISNWMAVTTGDYFEVNFGQTSGGNLNLGGSATPGGDAASLQIEWLP